MGGLNIIGILKDAKEILKNINTLILSPNNYQEDVKRYLCSNNFYILDEDLVEDSNFIYQIIVFKHGKKKYSKREYFFGPILIQKKGKLFYEYYSREKERLKILENTLPKNYWFLKYKKKKTIKMIEKELIEKD